MTEKKEPFIIDAEDIERARDALVSLDAINSLVAWAAHGFLFTSSVSEDHKHLSPYSFCAGVDWAACQIDLQCQALREVF